MIFGIAFLTLGVLALLQQLGYLPADLDLFWTIVFLAFGLSLITGKKEQPWNCCTPTKNEK